MSAIERDYEAEEKIIKDNIAFLNQYKGILSNADYNELEWLVHRGRIAEFRDVLLSKIFPNESDSSMNTDNTSPNSFGKNYWGGLPSKSAQIDSLYAKINEVEEYSNHLTLLNAELQKNLSETKKSLDISQKEINQLIYQNKELQSRVHQKLIDEKIPGYVDSVKSELSSDDNHFIFMSKIWAGFGGLFGIAAVVASLYSLSSNINFENLKGFELFYSFTRGLLGISILSWLSYICLSNSKKYTHESIRRKDRRHALMFGQVFLQIYGSTATKEDAILVFKDWNMSGDSAFSDHTNEPPGITSLFEAAKEKMKSSITEK
ncbi:hypothetical protein ACX3OY_09730 [Citrobacter farmeri]